MFDKIVSSIGRFSFKNRKLIAVLGFILLIAVIILESQTIIEYSYAEDSIVTDIFPQDDIIVLVYENKDEKMMSSIIDMLSKDEHVTSIQAYANTLGAEMSVDDVAGMFGIDRVFVNTLFYLCENGFATEGMTFVDFATFITSDDFINNEMFAPMLDEASKAQIAQLGSLVNALTSTDKYSAEEISAMFGVDVQMVQSVFYIKQLQNINYQNFANTIFGTIAGVLGVDAQTIEKVFNITPVTSLNMEEFVRVISDLSAIADAFVDSEQGAQLHTLIDIYDAVKSNKELSPSDIVDLFGNMADTDMFTEENLTLLYIMSRSNTMDMSSTKIPLYDFFTFLSEEIITNEAFSSYFDEAMLAEFESAKTMMSEGIAQLVGPEHSRMVITVDYVLESPEINKFYADLTDMLDNTLSGNYYLVGNSAMSYEVSQTFDQEYLIISIVTAIAVFLVVYMSFRKFSVSLLLICVIECAVFAMMSVMAVTGSPMFFIALILVQCILMGSMIDYAILFTTYYREVRKEYVLEEALPVVMTRATYAILTSSLILVLVTFICGFFMTGTVAAILQTLSIGAFCAILLILFVLPSYLVLLDKFIIKESKEKLMAIEE
ncbi:MAG: MMPL family transporter [Clostridia bacterium]|nr:MMPL family transporter [Clostridia bacterium]